MASFPVWIVCGAGFVSGKEIMALELAQGVRRLGHPVRFITSSWSNGDFPARLQSADLVSHVLPIGFISLTLTWDCMWMNAEQLVRWPGLVIGYRRLLRRERPWRIVHTNWHHMLLLGPFLRPERDLFWVHESFPRRPHYRRLFRWFERRVAGFVCVSHAVAASLRDLGVPDSRIHVVHNGIADPACGRTTAAQSAGARPFRIGIVGQVGHWKGHGDLLDALRILRTKLAQAELHVFGTGSREAVEQLKKRSASLGISDAVVWHGFVDDRERIYRHLDVCAVVSRSEDPLPTSAIEAQFFSLPVVATRVGGLPEIVEHQVTGLLVEPGAPAQIAEALERLANDSELRRSFGRRAQRNAVERFSNGRFIAQFRALLESVLPPTDARYGT